MSITLKMAATTILWMFAVVDGVLIRLYVDQRRGAPASLVEVCMSLYPFIGMVVVLRLTSLLWWGR